MGFPLNHLEHGRQHTCISSRVYALFPRDGSTMGPDLEDTSGGESDEEDEDEDVGRQLWPVTSIPAHTRARLNRPPIPGPSAIATRFLRSRNGNDPFTTVTTSSAPLPPTHPVSPLPSTRPVSPYPGYPAFAVPSFSLPASIWDENAMFTQHPDGTFHQHRFCQTVFAAACEGIEEVPPLRIVGRDMDEAAAHLCELLDAAGCIADYTNLLTEDRGCALTSEPTLGAGLDREVLFAVYTGFIKEEVTWFQRGDNGFLTIRPLGLPPAAIPAGLLVAIKRFGSVCGLLMVYGQWPGAISPALFQYMFQYMVHAGNLHSLRPSFVGEWYPELRLTLLDFLSLGPDADLERFRSQLVSYLDTEPAVYRTRTLSTHLAIGVMLLFKATMGVDTFSHPELMAFYEGFRLPCRNGFSLDHAIRNFEGGSETFLSLVATSAISSANSLLPHIQITNPRGLNIHLAALRAATGDITLTFDMLLERFLRGRYIPCRPRFEESRGAFHPIIDLSRVEEPGFRAQVLAWAATGSPFIDPTGGCIFFGPVGRDDPGYGSSGSLDVATREMLASNGIFLFRTCSRTAMYPVEYALELAQGHYTPESEPRDFQEAFDFWFLQQCLLAIGRHNML
ncbi:hypothetical protein FB451DRAFT_121952 [Mycena latifolia]|nr:hypothetical protein FB451DRAFT_121952 [Mycena latifolia]